LDNSNVNAVSLPTTSKNSMSYAYLCAQNGIQPPPKVMLSNNSKMPIDSTKKN
jgi:hypothetical protein